MAERPASAAQSPDDRTPGSQHLSGVAAIARRHDPDRFLCTLFAPAPLRETLFTLIAFNHELARAREVASNPMLALIRLQWWRDAVDEAVAGGGRRHEVAQPLGEAIRAGRIDPDDLRGMIDAREAETEDAIPSIDALVSYLRGTAGGFAVAAGRALGAAGAELAALQSLGAAYGLAGVLRSVPALAAQERCLLPADALQQAELSPEAVIADPGAAGLRQVVAGLAGLGQGWLTPVRVPRQAVAAALPGVLARRDLARLRRGGDPSRSQGRGLGDRLAVILAGLRGRI